MSSRTNNVYSRTTFGANTKMMTSSSQSTSKTSTNVFLEIYQSISSLISFFRRRVIFGPAEFKVILYLVIICVGALLRRADFRPSTYLASKTNIFNIYFVKLGWAWTLGLLLPFVYFNLRSTCTNRQILEYHLTRFLIATAFWYFLTNFFVHLELRTGSCGHEDFLTASKYECLQRGHKWNSGTDLSGHTFLLIYSLLMINEEVKSYHWHWKRSTPGLKSSGDWFTQLKENPQKLTTIFYLALAVLTVMWELMLLSTALYFHEPLHILGAALLAIGVWWLTYRLWYQPNSSSILRPSTPKEL